MSGTSFVIAAFAVWRLTHLLHAEDGPWRLVARARDRLGNGALGRTVGQMVDCFYCLSVWVALLVAPWLSGQPLDLLVATAALSGAAIALERVSGAFERHGQPEASAESTAASEPPLVARWHEDPLDDTRDVAHPDPPHPPDPEITP